MFDTVAKITSFVVITTFLLISFVPLSQGALLVFSFILLMSASVLFIWAMSNVRKLKTLFVENSFSIFVIGVFILATPIDDSVFRAFESVSQNQKDAAALALIDEDSEILERIAFLLFGPKNILEGISFWVLVLLFTVFPASRSKFLKSINVYIAVIVTLLEKLNDVFSGKNSSDKKVDS